MKTNYKYILALGLVIGLALPGMADAGAASSFANHIVHCDLCICLHSFAYRYCRFSYCYPLK
jgi:hypothetical protein